MKKVLVVDDDALIRFSLSTILRTEQTMVTAVETGGAALKEIGRDRYDSCLLDLHLPDIHGREVMQVIRGVSPSTRIAIMTGGEVSDELMAVIRKQAKLFLEKPFDLQEAKAFVEQGGDDREDASRDRDRIENAIVCSRRVCERTPEAKTIRYSIVQSDLGRREGEHTASVVDISAAGMGIRTLESLHPGQSIELVNGTGVRRGTVRWSQAVGSEKAYRAGIQYV